MKDLKNIGFEHVGRWHCSESGLQLSLKRLRDAAPALYAFVLRGEVMYVGKTKRTLGDRLYGYLKGSGTQRTNIRVQANILEALRDAESVDILGFRDPKPEFYGRFRLNLPAALEDDIIAQLDPPWNGGRDMSRTSGDNARPKEEEAHGPSLSQGSPKPRDSLKSKVPEGGLRPSFIVTMGKTYFRQGFFNVPVDHERYFAGDGAIAAIYLPGVISPVHGKLNRSANGNHTPRVIGGVKLRDWLQRHVRAGAQIRVVIHGPKHITVYPV